MKIKEEWLLNDDMVSFIAEETENDYARTARVVKLFEEGNEVAYVARYRIDVHGGMSCEQLRKTYETFEEAKELNKKVEKAVTSLTTKIKSKEELKVAIERLKEAREIEDVKNITTIYASKRKTKADKARELGLESVSQRILDGETVNLTSLIGSKSDLKNASSVEEHIGYCIADILDKKEQTLELVKRLSRSFTGVVIGELSAKAKKWTAEDQEFSQIRHFDEYTKFRKNANSVQNYQVLALSRAEEKGVIIWKVDATGSERDHPGKRIRVANAHQKLYDSALKDSIKRLFIPRVERYIKKALLSRAEQGAIECFARNLGQLFSQEGIRESHVVALDPGFSAIKAAWLDSTGSVLDTREFGLAGKQFNNYGRSTLKEWAKKSGKRLTCCIGNGKASLETQFALTDMISKREFEQVDVKFCVVSENGASKYSITELAEKDLPGMDPKLKSAVSIGRRLIDPLGEYVKIEPKHLGMGMYQHSVNEKKLSTALELVVRERVSMRGVDLNVASEVLLQKVCGLNAKTAARIIELRSEAGRIGSREELKKVKGLGPKAFEQCAGFLTISQSSSTSENSETEPKTKKRKLDTVAYDPLDSTIVHPTQYKTAREILKKAGLSGCTNLNNADVREKLQNLQKLTSEEEDVRKLMCTESTTLPPPVLLKEVRRVGSVRRGERMYGRVSNLCDFGAFIDIGVETNVLAHKSVLRQPYPQVGENIMVEVTSVDEARKRIGVKILD